MKMWHSGHPEKKSSDLPGRSPVCFKDKIRPRKLKHRQWEEIGRRGREGLDSVAWRPCEKLGLLGSREADMFSGHLPVQLEVVTMVPYQNKMNIFSANNALQGWYNFLIKL